ncbi:MAG: hypothetical protein ACTSWY_05820, partial [Promethearchaeota archaeon]
MSSDISNSEGPSVKKRALTLIIIGTILVGGWITYTGLSAMLFQGTAYTQEENTSETESIIAELSQIAFPNFTMPDNWMDLFKDAFESGDMDMDLESLLAMLVGAALLSGMLGGFDNLEQLMAVVFRVYPEDDTTIHDSDLWRYSAYDEYQGNAWARSDESTMPIGTVSDDGENTYHDKYLIRIPFGQTESTTIALPTCFPYPSIEEGSIDADNLLGIPTLLKDTMNGSTIELSINPASGGNLSYNLFREEINDESY